ncbi:MAG: protein-disulfide reductase DsbD family protein [Agriterribacter sp.]
MKTFILLVCAVSVAQFVHAQNPVTWNCTAKKTGDKAYEIHLTAAITKPWHVYSQATPDGGPVATAVAFCKNPLVVLDGSIKEIGKLIQKHEEVFGVDVKYYERTLDLVQVVRLKSKVKTTVSGSVNFMVCNDKECLPPKKVPFSVVLK